MNIFKTYTGNAMLNNALMTIEALGELNSVADITPQLLLTLYKDKKLKDLNKRLKSYTMLFTKNGPLKNDRLFGDRIYDGLFDTILNNFENSGSKKCEISGLSFETEFDTLFIRVLQNLGISKKEIAKKDTTINRVWFPLLGGLGSDAQALPQAKFVVQIHPICVVILQFLPLSSFLYKGAVLLVDSTNFDFAREFLADQVMELQKRIQSISTTMAVENVKDYVKGNYLLRAIDILSRQNRYQNEYINLTLWSFSNLGTGASCEIDRVPNALIKKLLRIKSNITIRAELEKILSNTQGSQGFLDALEGNQDWYGLYPGVFGSGKKKVINNGVSPNFLEAYYKEIDSPQKVEYAKHLACLIEKYKSKSFEKYLEKTDAWNDTNYRTELYAVLVEACQKGEWELGHHFEILDEPNTMPMRNRFRNIHRITHFYYQWYQKNGFPTISALPTFSANGTSQAQKVCEWLIAWIQKDEKRSSYEKRLSVKQEYNTTNYSNLLCRASEHPLLEWEQIMLALYRPDLQLATFDTNELLHLFFCQLSQQQFEPTSLPVPDDWTLEASHLHWFEHVALFAKDYKHYFVSTKQKGKEKYSKDMNAISLEHQKFISWFEDTLQKYNEQENCSQNWDLEKLIYPAFANLSMFALKFHLLKTI
jgi:hypothetical protein